jgi:hypothetical protein
MKPRQPAVRKVRKDQYPRSKTQSLLSVRSALILALALLTAIGAAGLLYAAHRPVALIVLGGLGAFAAALKLLNDVIDQR